jgi:hypothetical protein
MAAAGGQKQQSSRLQAHVPSWSSRRALSHDVKTTRPCSVPRTARARTTAAPPTTRPVALTLQQGRRHLWQAKQAMLHLRHNDRVKKVRHVVQFSYPFPLPLSLSCYRDRERGYSERDPSPRRKRAPSPPTYQRFEGWPLGRVRQLPQSTRASRPLLIRGSKAGPSEGLDSRLRTRRARDDSGYVRYMAEARAVLRGTLGHFRDQRERFCNGIPSEGGIEPSDPIKRDRVRQITCWYFWSVPLGH